MTRDRRVLAVIAALFGVVTVLRFSSEDVGDGYALLYMLPIALAALEFRVIGGLAAAAVAEVLVIVWVQTGNASLSFAGYATRATAFLVLGGLVGHETAKRRRAEQERERLLSSVETLARTDQLTDLANRRGWDEALRQELEHARRAGTPLSVALLDLDRFKRYNDHHGHPAGDEVLKQAADRWRAQVRRVDTLARYGGEEFAVLFPDCRAGCALEVVERLRSATPMGQTVSAGIAEWDGDESAEALIERADRALYEAKRHGRNRSSMSPGT